MAHQLAAYRGRLLLGQTSTENSSRYSSCCRWLSVTVVPSQMEALWPPNFLHGKGVPLSEGSKHSPNRSRYSSCYMF